MKRYLITAAAFGLFLSGCKFYGSALPPEYPVSMDDSLAVANDQTAAGVGTQRPVIRRPARPRIDNPSYIPEKELAVVSAPRTLLVWTYPHITDDNQRVFGSWSTIFLTDRYEWVPPANAVPADEVINSGGSYSAGPSPMAP